VSPPGTVPNTATATPIAPSTTNERAGATPQRGASERSPTSATATDSRVITGSSGIARLPGTTSAFQMPPRPSTLVTGEPQLSALAVNAPTPSGEDSALPGRSTEGTHHGAFSRTAPGTVTTRARLPAHTTASTAAMIPPVGVRTAGAQARISLGSALCSPRRTASPAAATHGRQAYATRYGQWPMKSRSAT
jgi:hypothetical protein